MHKVYTVLHRPRRLSYNQLMDDFINALQNGTVDEFLNNVDLNKWRLNSNEDRIVPEIEELLSKDLQNTIIKLLDNNIDFNEYFKNDPYMRQDILDQINNYLLDNVSTYMSGKERFEYEMKKIIEKFKRLHRKDTDQGGGGVLG